MGICSFALFKSGKTENWSGKTENWSGKLKTGVGKLKTGVGKLKTGPENVFHTFCLRLKKNERKSDSLTFVKNERFAQKTKE